MLYSLFLYFVADVVGREAVYGCQGKALPLVDCGEGALYHILSITVYTTGDAAKIQNANSTCITGVAECNRKILSKAIPIFLHVWHSLHERSHLLINGILVYT